MLSLLMLLFLATPISAIRGGRRPPPPADPFADPQNDPYNPLRYIASNALTAVAFSLILLVALIQTFSVWKWGATWMLSMVIGAYTFALGIATRFGLHSHPESKGLYIVEYLFVVLSPCAFIAATYMLLGRLTRHLDCDKYLLVSPRRITIVFLSSDITTFLIQAAGGTLSVSADNVNMAIVGSRIFLGGLALQLLSFFVFTCIYATFLYQVRTRQPETWNMDQAKPWYQDWRALAGALGVSCMGILVRSIYRTVELSEGFAGHLATGEAYFYGLDTLPLFIAIAIFLPFWPGRFISKESATSTAEEDQSGSSGSEKK